MQLPRLPSMFLWVVLLSAPCTYLIHWKWTNIINYLGAQDPESLYQHRRAVIRLVCERNNLTNSSLPVDKLVASQLFVEHSHRFIYCEVPKVGCSNWKRIILALNDSLKLNISQLRHYEVHWSPLLLRLRSFTPQQQKVLLSTYTTVMFTRHPLERVVSAYRDKFLHEDDVYYSKTIATRIRKSLRLNVSSTEEITFEQFIRFIVDEDPKLRDIHWRPMYELCDPCNILYNFTGRLETINRDADLFLKLIQAPEDLRYPTSKHHSNDSRTNHDLSRQYLKNLPPDLALKLFELYRIDFSMFEYEPYNIPEAPQIRLNWQHSLVQ